MAIFRAGKRIGPFDIRGGISRGDLSLVLITRQIRS